jgi:hypothetical protein
VDLKWKPFTTNGAGLIIKIFFYLYETMRKENRSQGSGGKQGEIKLDFKNQPFLTRLASCGRYSFYTTCHTTVLKRQN